jgi:hypothetical protein
MTTITIELTEQQKHFLKLFAANHYPGAEDNLATHKPMHVVQTDNRPYVDPEFKDLVPNVPQYRNVAYFFILEEAKRYMQYQGHNLISPRTYTFSSGYDNRGEYEHFWDLLLAIGKMLNENAGV